VGRLGTQLQRKLKQIEDLYPAQVVIDWTPFPGAQSMAFHCPADELFYGGQPAGGKSDLILGLALTAHQRSLILRRRALDLAAIKSRFQEITGRSLGLEAWVNDRYIQAAGCKDEGSKYKFQGQAHDLKAFDEITQFTRSQYEYIKTWNRTADPNQRCRTVCTFNPPTSPEQRWVLSYLAPWLDPKHPKPAMSGETRYYVLGEEVDSPDPIEVNGKLIKPVSRCFILSATTDNPLLIASGYDRILDNLPPELQCLTDFSAGIQDDPYQVIPTKWVELAQERWRSRNLGDVPSIIPQDAVACDPARGGADETAIAIRHQDWINCWNYPGKQTPDGITGAAKLLLHRQGNSRILLDVIGIGSAVQDTLTLQGHKSTAVIASASSYARTRSGQFGFANKRAEMWWKLREALDPAYEPTLALPPHPQLLGDLTAPKWNLTLKGILINSKEEIRCTLGRSTNVGDAVVMVADLGTMAYESAF
jgi:hypothetical protein